jgi:hypothetical protein
MRCLIAASAPSQSAKRDVRYQNVRELAKDAGRRTPALATQPIRRNDI